MTLCLGTTHRAPPQIRVRTVPGVGLQWSPHGRELRTSASHLDHDDGCVINKSGGTWGMCVAGEGMTGTETCPAL